MGVVDVVGFKGFLGAHVTYMTGNLQACTTLTIVPPTLRPPLLLLAAAASLLRG